ncbi:ATP-binding protein [Gordonia hydrophobica]|uniref:Biotin carboxylase N-terminal domain-containing protein n=1 Tax=Gordonia hydrophobica TaxID=40516 RepID=A0ABZ2TYJ2_9ACTN|nr:biotin carboxylase N-terminal domain-containing protein [Gordonia hydrophobica]MBM7365873.1 propionyl-CoA carboxylase alpha chain [Gordonia hydrophobica]
MSNAITPRTVTSVLVANRGEIAGRVFATCRAMGLSTVAVYSDPDADAPHVRAADAAVRLPGATSAETYLRGDLIIAAAQAAGADAIHPGYGFLSENAEFAQAVTEAGLVWIGPPPAAIRAMGSKVNAKALMEGAGVPVLKDIDPEAVTADDLPLLIKASAGGGGRGMRIVRSLDDLADAVAAARREAESAFGDPTVFCEPYIERGHHIEVQVMADEHGRIWTVGERECSIQRRHQKVIEEAPAPLVERIGGDLRERLFDAARKAVESIGYRGAGTVEFLVDAGSGASGSENSSDDVRIFFLETNTRLQVEHPVTELTTGVDLVEQQLLVAMGHPLGEAPAAAETGGVGHAIEVRLYAEDPAHDWQPQSGTIARIDLPATTRFGLLERTGIRVDSGIVDGSEISTFYDPMLAKVISWAPDRTQAAAILARALADARIHGLVTNRDLLVNTLREKDFLTGETDTGYLDEERVGRLSKPLAGDGADLVAAMAAALAQSARNRADARAVPGAPSGWRNLFSDYQNKRYVAADGTEIDARYRIGREGAVELPDLDDVDVASVTSDVVVLVRGGVARRYSVSVVGDQVFVDWHGASVTLTRAPRFVDPAAVQRPGSLLAPMPGSVIRVAVAEGDRVTAGQPLLWLEAMKMEHTISAPADGVVSVLAVDEGRQLAVGDVLAVITDDEDATAPVE